MCSTQDSLVRWILLRRRNVSFFRRWRRGCFTIHLARLVSDEKALEILLAVRSAIGDKKVKLAVIEMNMSNRELIKDQLDLYMHVLYKGKERSREQFEALFEEAGFDLVNTTATKSSADVFLTEPKAKK